MNKQRKTLYNGFSSNLVGYCHYHNCGVTKKQLNRKECLKKNCSCFERNENHQWWGQRARAKAKKKANKQIEELLF